MFKALSRYADFQGRSGRSEFWMFFLLSIIIYAVGYTLMIMGAAGASSAVTYDAEGLPVAATAAPAMGGLALVGLAITGIWWLVSIIPTIAVTIRRLHDQDKTGLLALLWLVPIGNFVLLVFMFLEGTRGPNQYGPDPRGY